MELQKPLQKAFATFPTQKCEMGVRPGCSVALSAGDRQEYCRQKGTDARRGKEQASAGLPRQVKSLNLSQQTPN
ncbi:MAG: hypothetical protein WCD69_10225 [Xanthobacteraceae bacterium]